MNEWILRKRIIPFCAARYQMTYELVAAKWVGPLIGGQQYECLPDICSYPSAPRSSVLTGPRQRLSTQNGTLVRQIFFSKGGHTEEDFLLIWVLKKN